MSTDDERSPFEKMKGSNCAPFEYTFRRDNVAFRNQYKIVLVVRINFGRFESKGKVATYSYSQIKWPAKQSIARIGCSARH